MEIGVPDSTGSRKQWRGYDQRRRWCYQNDARDCEI